jgi:carboxymethylenebutenolidase
VLFYIDAFGVRPAMDQMAQRLADGGCLVLLPDVLYREGATPPKTPQEVMADPKARERLMQRIAALDRDRRVSDAGAFVEFLAAHPRVKGERFAVAGYCMGGNMALAAAGAFPGRFAAVASFHGGNLATDKPDSPHRFVKGINARVYVAGASDDASFPEEQKTRLKQALTEAGVPDVIETYAGARHGFAVPDSPAFNAQAAERHWTALFQLLRESI